VGVRAEQTATRSPAGQSQSRAFATAVHWRRAEVPIGTRRAPPDVQLRLRSLPELHPRFHRDGSVTGLSAKGRARSRCAASTGAALSVVVTKLAKRHPDFDDAQALEQAIALEAAMSFADLVAGV
jgi:hypothetical protein